jgi:hypothetical protein
LVRAAPRPLSEIRPKFCPKPDFHFPFCFCRCATRARATRREVSTDGTM